MVSGVVPLISYIDSSSSGSGDAGSMSRIAVEPQDTDRDSQCSNKRAKYVHRPSSSPYDVVNTVEDGHLGGMDYTLV